ncbi:MAG: sulfotransferase family protein [Phycisphaerales bacterium]
MKGEPGRPPFFIVGSGRSGTTLLRLMLNRHSRLAIPPESHFIKDLDRRLGPKPHPRAFAKNLLAHPRFQEWELDPEVVERMLIDAAPPEPRRWYDLVFTAWADGHGKARWGDKTPPYALCLPLIHSLFPEAMVIHIIRDGRDVAASRKALGWAKSGVIAEALDWRRRVERARGDGRRLFQPRGRYHEVLYERLVERPETELAAICTFLDEPFEAAMLEYHEDAEDQIPAHRRQFHPEVNRPVQPTKIGRWRRDLSDLEVALFERFAGELLDDLGYERSGVVSRGARIRAAGWYATAPLRIVTGRGFHR